MKKRSRRHHFESVQRYSSAADSTPPSTSASSESLSSSLPSEKDLDLSKTVSASSSIPILGQENLSEAQAYMRSLPGVSDPLGFFDPLSLSKQCKTISEAKFFREAELMHCRTAMMAVVGVIFAEKLPVLNNFFTNDVLGPAVTHVEQAPNTPLVLLALFTSITEVIRAENGWVKPNKSVRPYRDGMLNLRDDHEPGDYNFDPWNLKKVFCEDETKKYEIKFNFTPGERYPVVKRTETLYQPDAFRSMQTKELNNGRLAMIAILAILTQESLYQTQFDYDYIHLESCLTPAACTRASSSALSLNKSSEKATDINSTSIFNQIEVQSESAPEIDSAPEI